VVHGAVGESGDVDGQSRFRRGRAIERARPVELARIHDALAASSVLSWRNDTRVSSGAVLGVVAHDLGHVGTTETAGDQGRREPGQEHRDSQGHAHHQNAPFKIAPASPDASAGTSASDEEPSLPARRPRT